MKYFSCLQHPLSSLHPKITFIIWCLMVNYCLFKISHSSAQYLACIIPSKISRDILQHSQMCDWYQTTLSHLIPFGHDFASLNTGTMVSPRLTTIGISSAPPSVVLNNTMGTRWSFHGSTGTIGISFNVSNVMPSHFVIHHWPLDSTVSLSCTPRQVIVWGLVDGEVNMRILSQSQHVFSSTLRPPMSISKEGVFLPLADFDFDITAWSLRQSFPFSLSWGIDFSIIVFDIRSNWGADITSLCAVHVHGHTVTYR